MAIAASAVAGLAGCTGEDLETTGAPTTGGSGSTPTEAETQTGTPTGSASPTQSPTATSTPTGTPTPDVKLLSHELYETSLDFAEVRGEVKNTTDSELGYVSVKVKFFDEGGTRLGTTSWNATEVSAGRTVAFETVMSTTEFDKVADYEIDAGTSL